MVFNIMTAPSPTDGDSKTAAELQKKYMQDDRDYELAMSLSDEKRTLRKVYNMLQNRYS